MTFKRLAFNNVWRDKWTYLAYFLSSIFSVLLFFLFSVSMFHPDLDKIQSGSSLSMAMGAGNILIYLFSFFFISYSIGSFLKNKQKILGVFILNGASKKQINKMIFIENMLVGVVAIIVAIILGLALTPLALMVSSYTLGIEGFNMYLPIKAIILTSGLFLGLFFLISIISPRFVRKEKVLNLLRSDKKDEKDIKISPFFMTLGIISIFALIILIILKKIELILSSTIGIFGIFLLGLVSLYFLIIVISKLVLELIIKSKHYYKKTNMLLIAEFKSKFRTNINMIFMVTILLIVAFSVTTLLYGMRKDVEVKTLESYPFNYIYIVNENTVNIREKLKALENTLSTKDGYVKSKFDILSLKDIAYTNIGIISEREYNKAAQKLNLKQMDLNSNEIFIVPGKKMRNFNLNDNSSLKILEGKSIDDLKIIGQGERLITPEGYFTNLLVIEDEFYNSLDKREFSINEVNVFNVHNWKEDLATANSLRQIVTDNGENLVGFFSAGSLYETEKMTKNLMLYIGSALSIIFILAVASIIYFRLITEKESEAIKYKNLMKTGLSKKEFSTIIYKNIGLLMYIPFIIATIFLFIQKWILASKLNLNYSKATVGGFIIFLVIQTIGYLMTVENYKKSILHLIK
ncbi:ABC transporter permease [Tissierella pigra]|uniref:ABC transporter permease n=1 Tax=Tissierella pigra TaxID=2607614 RepID=A0A6N7XU45_9FIRM|nr:ABC transporter permease [Tissierella pigra]MBU5426830.1 ABC transporter permease [Tissierella pigra]MSU01297.1 ABC transporter permease [Tissierella pigra]